MLAHFFNLKDAQEIIMLNSTVNNRISLILLSITPLFPLQFYTFAAAPTNEAVLASAKEKGKSVAEYLAKSSGINPTSPSYFDVCSYYGYCLFYEALGDSASVKSIYDRYKQRMPSKIATDNIDNNAGGILPLHLYLIQKDDALLKLGKNAADFNISKNGWVRNAIDDTYMTGSLMVQAYRATKDTKYLDFGANFIVDYMGKLQQSNGLYWHKLDSKNFWGRGNGWGAASTTELLQELPTAHEKYTAVMNGYKKQMDGLLAVQQSNGMWMQLLDSKDPKNWIETSGSAMFLFAIFTGIRNGWLDKETFLEPAKKGWMALAGYLQNGKLTNVAAGFWPTTGTASDYLNASRGQPGDSHGTAAFLWAAAAAVNYFSNPPSSIKPKPAVPRESFNQPMPDFGKKNVFNVLGRSIAIANNPEHSTIKAAGVVITNNGIAEKNFINFQ